MAAKAIKGITIELGGDSTKLDKALESPQKRARDLQAELKQVDKLLKFDPKNTELLAQKQKLLAEAVGATKEKLDILKKAQEQVADSAKNYDAWKAKYDPIQAEIDETGKKLQELKKKSEEAAKALEAGEISDAEYKAIQQEIEETETHLKGLKKQAKETTEEFGNPASPEALREVQRQVSATEQELKELEKQAKQSSDAIVKIADAAQKVGEKSITLGKSMMPLTGAITGAAVASGKFASDFNDSMAKASTLIDTSIYDMDDLKEKVLEVSDRTGVAAEQLGESMYNALSASIPMGEQGAGMMDFLEKNTRLARVGFTDIDTAVTATAKTMNAYNMGAEETDRVHRIMLQTQNKGITTINELGSVLSNVTPTAAAMSVAFEQVGAGIAVMTARGTPAAQATTQLNALISELGKEGTKSSDILKNKTGQSFKQLMEAGYTLTDVLALMQSEMGGSTQAVMDLMAEVDSATGQTKTFEQACGELGVSSTDVEGELIDMFGSLEAGKAALSIGGENAAAFTDALESMSSESDIVGEAFTKMETDSYRAQVALTQLKNIGITLGTTLLSMLQPAFQKISETVQKASDWFGGLSDKQKQMILVIAGLIAAIGPALIIFGKMATGISSILSVGSKIAPLFGVIKTALAGLMATPVGWVVAAIVALVAILVTAYNKCEWFRNMVNEAFAQIKEAIASAMESAKPAIEKLMQAFQKLMDALRPVIEFILKVVVSAFKGLASAFEPIIKAIMNVVDFITNIIGAIKALFTGDWDALGQHLLGALQNMIDFVKNIFQSIGNFIVTFFDGLGIDIVGFFTGIWDSITSVFSGIGQWFADRWADIKGAFSAVATWFLEIHTQAYNNVVGVFQSIGQWFADRWADIKGAFSAVATWFLEIHTQAYNNVVGVFQSIGQWFADRWADIKGAFSAVATWFLEIHTQAYNNVVGVFQSIGQWFADRWTDIKAALAFVGTWFLTMFQNAYNNVVAVFQAIGSWFAARWQDIQNALSMVATWFLTIFQNAYNNVVAVFQAIGSWFAARWQDIQNVFASVVEFFRGVFTNAWNAITGVFANVGGFFSDLWNNIVARFTDIGTKIGEAVGGAFKSIVNGVIGTAENIVNGFFRMINGAIGVLNAIPGVSIGEIGYLNFPRLAKGGVLHEGDAILAEAGPEVIRVSNGRAIVTPLTRGARNTALAAAGGDGGGIKLDQKNYFYSPKNISPAEAARQQRRATQKTLLRMRKGKI